MPSLLRAFTDPRLLGPHFDPWAQWRHWAVVIAAIMGEPLDAHGRVLFKKLFGFAYSPGHPASESLILAGRGSGKSKVGAALVTCIAVLRDWSHLKRRARILLLSCDREQSQESFSFVEQYFQAPALAALVVSKTKSSITLRNNLILQIRTASPRGLRGPSVAAAIVDEVCFLPREPSAASDTKVFRALRPALSKVEASLLISISSTGARDGVAYDLFTKYYGVKDAPVLVCRAKSTDLNLTAEHARARAAAFDLDPYSAAAEYDSTFFESEDAFVQRDRLTVIEAQNPTPPQHGRLYCGLDPSGGAERGDSFTMACAWPTATGRIGVGLIEARAGRRDPVETCQEFCHILKPYRSRVQIVSDRYAAAFVPSLFRRHGLTVHAPHRRNKLDGAGRMNQSDYFLALLGRLKLIDWPNHAPLLRELLALVRNADGVSHPSGAHDDIIGSVSRAVHGAALYLDAHAPAAELDDPEPEDAERGFVLYGDEDVDHARRRDGVTLPGEDAPGAKPLPHPDSLSERIKRSIGNTYTLASFCNRREPTWSSPAGRPC